MRKYLKIQIRVHDDNEILCDRQCDYFHDYICSFYNKPLWKNDKNSDLFVRCCQCTDGEIK